MLHTIQVKNMTTFRGFIAVDVTTTPFITEFEHNITKSGADVKLVDPTIIHITLKFLGDTDEKHIETIEQQMKESIQGIQPFAIQLIGTGVFPNQNYMKVVWIGIENSEPLKKITNNLNQTLEPLGFTKEKKDFSPHLTIGRVKTAKNKQQLLSLIQQYSNTDFGTQEINIIKLKKSDLTPRGPIYTTLKEIKLTNR